MVITRATYPRLLNTSGLYELDVLKSQQSYIWDRTATLQTNCIANQIAMSDLNFYNLSLLEKAIDGMVAFEFMKIETLFNFIHKYTALFDNEEWANKARRLEGHSLSGAMLDLYDFYINEKCPEIEAINLLADVMFPSFNNINEQRLWLNLTYNSIKRVTNKLTDVIKRNYKMFGITPKEANEIIADINTEDYVSLRSLFKGLTPKFYRNRYGTLNMWCVGLGTIVFSVPVKDDTRGNRNLAGWKDGLLDYNFNDSIFYYLTKYDMTIVSHGDELTHVDNDIFIQPTRNPFNAMTYKSASKLIMDILQTNTVRRINLLTCNPHKQRIYPQLYKEKSCLINIHEGNVIIG